MRLFNTHWLGSLMNEVRSLLGMPAQAVHVSYEKAGLILRDPVVPWSADAVLVEASMRLSASARNTADFALRDVDGTVTLAERLNVEEGDRCRVFFRLPTPAHARSFELTWQQRQITTVEIPVLSGSDYVQGLRVEMPTFFACLGSQQVACQTFVASQCLNWQATALVASRTASLAPLIDLNMHVEFRSERDDTVVDSPVIVTSGQMQGRQALVSASPRHLPRRLGAWSATWLLGDQPLASHRIKAISRAALQKSLRVSDTRFVAVDRDHRLRVCRKLPELKSLERLGPCFFVSSGEAGAAGLCSLQVRADSPGSPVLMEQELLVTDGPTTFAPGTIDIAGLANVHGFELLLAGRSLGMVSLKGAPTAKFNAEGAFEAPTEFAWSPAADNELTQRLQRLMKDR